MDGRRLADGTQRGLSIAGSNAFTRVVVPFGVAVSCIGWQMGKAMLIRRPLVTNQQINTVVPDERVVSSNFLYYALTARREEIFRLGAGGSRTPILNKSGFEKVRLHLPPLPEQRRIAAILGALDDKIELNRKMNRTLEEMAQALFKSWFIDFDGHDDLVDSEVGPVPRGWTPTSLGAVVEILDSRRVPISGFERAEKQGPYPYYGAASVMDHIDAYLFDGVYVLVGEDGTVVDNEGHPITQYVWGQFWVNNHAHVLQPAGPIGTEHLLLALRNVNIRPFITGAVQAKVSQGNLRRVPFVLPPTELCDRFTALATPLFARVRANTDESATLATLRDTLLLKLISGELGVPEAEATIAEAL
jgi:type I restriction enzyme S subunit